VDETGDAHGGQPTRLARRRFGRGYFDVVSTLQAVPLARRAQAGGAALLLSAALIVAGIAPLARSAPAWLRIAGVLLLLLGLLLGLIASGLLNTVRQERRHRAALQAQFALDATVAAACSDFEEQNGLTGSPCGPDGCGGACALAALRADTH
jgi:hypothetical protein